MQIHGFHNNFCIFRFAVSLQISTFILVSCGISRTGMSGLIARIEICVEFNPAHAGRLRLVITDIEYLLHSEKNRSRACAGCPSPLSLHTRGCSEEVRAVNFCKRLLVVDKQDPSGCPWELVSFCSDSSSKVPSKRGKKTWTWPLSSFRLLNGNFKSAKAL